MTLHCAACGFVNQQVDDETAFCPNCGAAYAPDNAPTVAMGPSFADAPPYRTPAATTPYGTAGAVPYRTPIANTPYGTPPFAAFGPDAPPIVAPKPASRVGAFVVGVIVTLSIIVLAVAGFVAYAAIQRNGTTTGTSTSTSATSTPQVPTVNPAQLPFTLTAPQDWATQTVRLKNINGTRTSYIAPDQLAAISVFVIPASTPLGGFSLAATVKMLKGTQYKRTSSGTMTYANTGTWVKVTGTYISRDGVPYQIIALNHRHVQHLFIVGFLAPQSSFAALDSADFEPLMQSFAFV
jgi:hypothetical protein